MMNFSVYASLLIFSLVMSITPGPNNLLLATSGLAYGFRRTLPALFGTLAGLAVLFVISGAGVGAIVLANPHAQVVLRAFGAGYLAYLALRLWRASTIPDAQRRSPLRIWHAAAFQFINPKAWMMTVTAVSLYVAAAPSYWVTLAVVSATFLVVSVPSITIWAAFGAAMKSALREPSRVKLFNRAMAVLTILSAGLVFLWS